MRMRRPFARLALGCLALGLSQCKVTDPDGTLSVIHSCSRADAVTVSIDGSVAGTVASRSSTDFPLKAGSHTTSARSGNGVTWASRTVTITSGGKTVFDLLCI